MAQTLYRKYRPQTFADVVGQAHVTTALINQIKHDQVAHAYLFAGPRGVGKTTTARLLSRAVQAHDSKTGEPDYTDPIVQALQAGTSMDVVEIDAASNRRIEEVRELREHVKYPPNQAKMKVFIIDEVHMLTTEAFNALLKTLEEPPAYVLFILATTELHKLPDTIISRCQRFDFYPVKPPVLQQRLETLASAEGIEVDAGVLHTIVKLSGGCVRDAESLLGQVLSLGGKKITADDAAVLLPTVSHEWVARLWLSVHEHDKKESLKIIEEMAQAGADIKGIFDDFLELLRHILLWKVDEHSDAHVFVITEVDIERVKATLPSWTIAQIQQMIAICIEHKQHVGISPVPQLPLEMALLAIHGLSDKSGDDSSASAIKNEAQKTQSSDIAKQSSTTTAEATIHDAELWNPVLAELQQEQPALAQYLLSAVVVAKNGILEVTVGHSFHYEIVKKPQNIALIEQAIQTISGKNLGVQINLDEQVGVKAEDNSQAIDDIAKAFGGEVVTE